MKYFFISLILFICVALDWFRVNIFLVLDNKILYNILFNYFQPFVILVSLIYILFKTVNNFKYIATLAVIILICITRIYADIPSNISKCQNGKIEIQKISFTGAGFRYYLGEKTDNWTVMGWVKDDCGIPYES